ncbi:MAG: UDP-N-acetylmuramoyl-tripeptide--D-alanyl-D-alanine ligase [Phycisphaerales bacterium]
MTIWRPDSMREATGGRWVSRPGAADTALAGLSIDSRTIRPGQVFLALRGERFDGHDFLDQAIDAGAAMLIVEPGRAPTHTPESVGVLEAPGAVAALAAIASAHRRSLPKLSVVCVTGSNGKTTTCNLLNATLSARLRGVVSEKSFNNHIGLPLTLLRATPEDRFVVCETGTSAPGEIAALTAIAKPDVAVITSIGRAHLERLGDLRGVAREKASIARGLSARGRLLATADSPDLRPVLDASPAAAQTTTFGVAPDAHERITDVEAVTLDRRDGVRFRLTRTLYEVPLAGAHNATNGAATVLVARLLGLDDDSIHAGLDRATPPPMRMQRSLLGGVTLCNDAYNANPESMIASCAAFLGLAPTSARRVLVLGDMLELGAGAAGAHEEVGRRIGDAGCVDVLCCVGGLARSIGAGLSSAQPEARIEHIDNDDAMPDAVARLLRPGDWALLKGSRGVRLERVEDALRTLAGDEHEREIPGGARCSSIS